MEESVFTPKADALKRITGYVDAVDRAAHKMPVISTGMLGDYKYTPTLILQNVKANLEKQAGKVQHLIDEINRIS